MPKHSRSRSPRDKKHKHRDKDKKKHRKSSRSRSKERRSDRRSPKYGKSGGFDKGKDQDNGEKFEAPMSRFKSSKYEESKQDTTSSYDSSHQQNSPSKSKMSRFSSQPVQNPNSRFSEVPPDNKGGNFIAPQTQPSNSNQSNRPRRRKNVWTDADENEIREQLMIEKKKSLDESHPALMIGSDPNLLKNINPAILNALQDSSKIKKKIYLPKNSGINYIGLLIGPRGLYQKRLEEESGCKILIRGKGSQKEGSAPQPDDDDEQHVLIIGDSPDSVRRAINAIERVISADDSTRDKIRQEQLEVAQQINNRIQPNCPMDDSMMTPYGPPSSHAYIIPVPNDCVGLIIGKGGDTIRQLQMESGAKIQVAKKEIENSNLRNVFVEGPPERYQKAKEMIEEIIREHRRTADPQVHVGDYNPFPGPHQKVKVPDKYVGLIIGKNGDTLKGIAQRSNTKIFVPQKNIEGCEERTIEMDGDLHCVEIARQEIISLIQRYMSQSSTSAQDYGKNPYGSGILIYNQQKQTADGSVPTGGVPDSLKAESNTLASSLLTSNPILAEQLTGWSYQDPHAPAQPKQEEGQNPEGQADGQNGYYDYQGYQNYYGTYPEQYNQQQYQEYYQQYGYGYGQEGGQVEGQVPPTDGTQDPNGTNNYQQYQDYYNQQWNQYYQQQQQYAADPNSAQYYEQQQQYYQNPAQGETNETGEKEEQKAQQPGQ